MAVAAGATLVVDCGRSRLSVTDTPHGRWESQDHKDVREAVMRKARRVGISLRLK